MNEPSATSAFAPLWRRKWLILAVGVLVGVASYAYYKGKTPVYSSTTQVYLGASAEELAPGEKATKNTVSNANDALIINSIVVEQVRHSLRAKGFAHLARSAKVKAKAAEKSDFITITAEAGSARTAVLLANTTAAAFIKRQNDTRLRTTNRAISITRRQLRRIEAASVPKPSSTGKSSSRGVSTSDIIQAANLNTKINQLESSLQVTSAEQIKVAKITGAQQLSPKPRKNAEFGFVIGILLASIAAYAFGRFDQRVRSLGSVEGIFKSQILTGLPEVKKPVVREQAGARPSRVLLEPLRRLNTSLNMTSTASSEGNGGGQLPRVLLFTSPDLGDGKSTVVADLGLVKRDAGRRVVIVEANFRRPVQAKLLGLDGAEGLAEVLSGTREAGDVMRRLMPAHADAAADETAPAGSAVASAGTATVAQASAAGSLFLLAGDAQVANPPALLGDSSFTDLLQLLLASFDDVLVDAPSPLEVSDVLPLLAAVDGIVVVARIGHTRELAADRLVQMLEHTSHAPILGTVANCVPRAEAKRNGFVTSRGSRRGGLGG